MRLFFAVDVNNDDDDKYRVHEVFAANQVIAVRDCRCREKSGHRADSRSLPIDKLENIPIKTTIWKHPNFGADSNVVAGDIAEVGFEREKERERDREKERVDNQAEREKSHRITETADIKPVLKPSDRWEGEDEDDVKDNWDDDDEDDKSNSSPVIASQPKKKKNWQDIIAEKEEKKRKEAEERRIKVNSLLVTQETIKISIKKKSLLMPDRFTGE